LRFREVATGQERWSVISATPVFDEEGRVRLAVNIFRDITASRHAEEALRQSEELYRTVVEQAAENIFLVRDGVLRTEVRKILYRMHDLERLAARLLAGRASARDLSALQRSLSLLPELAGLLHGFGPLQGLLERLPGLMDVTEQIATALVLDPPFKITDGA